MVKYLLLVILAFVSICGSFDIVYGNPIPWGSPWEGKAIQYFTIIVAEFCSLITGTAILTHNNQVKRRKAILTILTALITSYAIGIIIWGLGGLAGILIFSPTNPLFGTANSLSSIILLLPEFFGTIIGAIIIRTHQKVKWKMAFTTMTTAMCTSFLVGLVIPGMYSRLFFG